MKNIRKYWLVLFFAVALILPISALAATTAEELMTQIAELQRQIQQLQVQLAQVQGTAPQWCHTFNVNLKVGDSGSEVGNLVTVLKKEGFEIDNLEQGDSVNVTLEESTASAVSGLQQKYADEILKPAGLRYGTGYVGKLTRAKLNQLYGCGVKPKPQPFPCPAYAPPTPDFCAGGNIIYPEKDENGCFRPPKCILPTDDNQPPVIHGVGGPTTLGVWETGTWVIKAYDPENGPLTYDVAWGDTFGSGFAPQTALLPSQTATFTHSYSSVGTYNPVFTVTDSKGLSAKTSISVNVGLTPATVSEQVKCVFYESKTEQKCYSSNNYTCSGVETCVIDVKGVKGEQITWKSSCGGYAYTTMDGQNEYAEFKCAASTIPPTPAAPSITVLSPNGGEKLTQGQEFMITWKATEAFQTVRISLYEFGKFKEFLAVDVPNTGNWLWKIPSPTTPTTIKAGSQYSIRIFNLAYPNIWDDSDNYFSIVTGNVNQPPTITEVTSPNTLKMFEVGTWTVKASDPEQGILTYSVSWGDNLTAGTQVAQKAATYTQTETFSHAYFKTGTYYPVFIVTDDKGFSAKSAFSGVAVGEVVGTGFVRFRLLDASLCPGCLIGTICAPCPPESERTIYNAKITVYDEKGNYIATKDTSSGLAVFENLAYGNYTAVFSAPGFETDKSSFMVAPNFGTDSTVNLKKSPTATTPTITVPFITLLSPNGGETWTFGKQYDITWKSSGVKTASVYLWFSDGTTCKLADMPAENGKYLVQFAENQLCTTQNISIRVTAGRYRIKIYTEDGKVDDSSDNYFSIVSAGTTSQLDVLNQMANTLESARIILNQMVELLKNR